MIPALKVFDAIVLAGGSSRRFGGGDKALASLAGRSFLDHALQAVGAAQKSVVVGPRRPGYEPTIWVEEADPSGPVSALRSGVAVADAEIIVVLAVDMPLVSAVHVGQLVDALSASGAHGVALAQVPGAPQYLAAAYRRDPLQRRLLGRVDDVRLRDVMEDLHIEAFVSEAAYDCDSPEELEFLVQQRTQSRR